MRRPFYRRTTPPKPSLQIVNLQALRERILNAMLYAGIAFGTITIIPNLISDIQRGNAWIIAIYVPAYVWMIVAAFAKKLPVRIRAGGFLVVPYLLGVASTVLYGVVGDGRVWLLCFAALAAALLGLRAGIVSLIISGGTYLGIGGLMSSNLLLAPTMEQTPDSRLFLSWSSTGTVYLLLSTIIVISIAVLIEGINASYEQQRKLANELNSDREELQQRTRELDHRLLQLRTAATISRTLSGVLEIDALLQQVVDLVIERFNLYWVGVFLLDKQGESAVLHAGTGEAGKGMIADGFKVPVDGTSMVSSAIATRKPRIALSVRRETARFHNPYLPRTRSELALPLLSGEQVLGALSIQSEQIEDFDEDDILMLEGIADSLSTAIKNARLFQQVQDNLEDIRALNRQYLADAWKKVMGGPSKLDYEYESERIAEDDGQLSTIRVPLTLREQVIGQLSLVADQSLLTSDDMAFIEQVTTQAALALENVRLLEETQRRAGHDRLIAEVARKARAATDVDAILRTTVGELGRALGAYDGLIKLEVQDTVKVRQEGDR